jgi:hypothetical protein
MHVFYVLYIHQIVYNAHKMHIIVQNVLKIMD